MSSQAQIQNIRKTEQRFPTDLIRNGHQYIKGYKVGSRTVNKLREIRQEKHAIRTS